MPLRWLTEKIYSLLLCDHVVAYDGDPSNPASIGLSCFCAKCGADLEGTSYDARTQLNPTDRNVQSSLPISP